MPLPTIADVHRVSLEWANTTGLKPAANVFHMHFVGTPAALFAIIDANVTRNMWANATDQSFINAIVITPLDGSSAGQVFSPVGVKYTGNGGSNAIPQQAALVSMGTGLRGSAHRGRVYLPYTAEGVQSGGVLNAGVRTNIDTAWLNFYTTCLASLAVLGVASYKHSSFNATAFLITRSHLATQRRRQGHD